jgi:predicted Zn-dependent protease
MDALAAAPLPGAADLMLDHQGFVLAYAGRLGEADAKVGRAVDLAVQDGEPERAGLFIAGTALWNGYVGNAPQARRGAKDALALSQARDVEYGAALALALAGDWAGAQRLTDDLARRFPEDTAVRFSYLPVLRARLALGRNAPAQAIEALRPAAANELGVPPSASFGFYGALYPVYTRGEAFLAARRGPEAAAEFRKILARRGITISDPIGVLAHLQLARALALAGDRAGAKSAYREFFTRWAKADETLPIVLAARAEAARLD